MAFSYIDLLFYFILQLNSFIIFIQVTVDKKYYEWLLDVRHFMHQKDMYNANDLISLPILYLSNPTSGGGIYALKVRIESCDLLLLIYLLGYIHMRR